MTEENDAGAADDPRVRTARAARHLVQRLVGGGAPAETLAEVTADLERAIRRLDGAATDGDGTIADRMTVHPFTGPANPLAPPLVVRTGEGRADVDVTYGTVYEGPPGRVHGGFIAAGFDVALGRAVGTAVDGAVFTGTLSIRYRRPTPILVPVRYEAEVTGIDGRKITVTARLVAAGEVTCEAEGIWIRAAA